MPGKGLLERLAEGPVIGDGGFVFALEKRGYVKAGPWTPEATVEHPEAGRLFAYMNHILLCILTGSCYLKYVYFCTCILSLHTG